MTINYYNKNAEDFFRNTVNVSLEEIYIKFEKYLSENSRILDLGCGSGRDSKYFLDNNYGVVPVDLSDELIKRAQDYTGIKVLKKDMLELDFESDFDGIWACASILHIPRKDIKIVFDNCSRALKKNGVMYLSFKYGDHEIEKNGRFFNYYDVESFSQLISSTNFDILETWITTDVRQGREDEQWLNAVIRKRG